MDNSLKKIETTQEGGLTALPKRQNQNLPYR